MATTAENARLDARAAGAGRAGRRRRPPTCGARLAAEGRDAEAALAALGAVEPGDPGDASAGARRRGRRSRAASAGAGAAAPRGWLLGGLRRSRSWPASRRSRWSHRPAPQRGGREPSRHVAQGDHRTGRAARCCVYRHRGERRRAAERRRARGPRRPAAARVPRGPGGRFGVLLSIDGAGHVTLHLPESAARRRRADAQGEIRLPSAYELDDAPAFERFLLVTSAAPFRRGGARRRARPRRPARGARAAPLPLPASFTRRRSCSTKTRNAMSSP